MAKKGGKGEGRHVKDGLPDRLALRRLQRDGLKSLRDKTPVRYLPGVGAVKIEELTDEPGGSAAPGLPLAAPFAGAPSAKPKKPGLGAAAIGGFTQKPAAAPASFLAAPKKEKGEITGYSLVPVDTTKPPRRVDDLNSLHDLPLYEELDKLLSGQPSHFKGSLDQLKRFAQESLQSADIINVFQIIQYTSLKFDADDELEKLREAACSILASVYYHYQTEAVKHADGIYALSRGKKEFGDISFFDFRKKFIEGSMSYARAQEVVAKVLVEKADRAKMPAQQKTRKSRAERQAAAARLAAKSAAPLAEAPPAAPAKADGEPEETPIVADTPSAPEPKTAEPEAEPEEVAEDRGVELDPVDESELEGPTLIGNFYAYFNEVAQGLAGKEGRANELAEIYYLESVLYHATDDTNAESVLNAYLVLVETYGYLANRDMRDRGNVFALLERDGFNDVLPRGGKGYVNAVNKAFEQVRGVLEDVLDDQKPDMNFELEPEAPDVEDHSIPIAGLIKQMEKRHQKFVV